ncbi:hypothetical protein [Ligilactobacillus ruminis]|uniref:hypothetical protein n=1 Tax=Ligilactobacillus ruminis TaxID=1623 RepID=UPI0034A15DEC
MNLEDTLIFGKRDWQKKAELKSLINQGATDAAIGAELGMTVSRVKYWIKEWNLGRRKRIITTGGSDNKQEGRIE